MVWPPLSTYLQFFSKSEKVVKTKIFREEFFKVLHSRRAATTASCRRRRRRRRRRRYDVQINSKISIPTSAFTSLR